MRSNVVLHAVALAIALLIYSRPASAQYRIDTWTTEQGLPQGSINGVVQARDGFLWIATFGGLVRFDGTTFRVFDTTTTPAFSTSRLERLYEDPEGGLWAVTEQHGLIRYVNGQFTAFSVATGKLRDDQVGRAYIDANGKVTGFATATEVVEWRNGALDAVRGDAFPRNGPGRTVIGNSAKGAVWFQDATGTHRWERGSAIRDVALPDGLRGFGEDSRGNLWWRKDNQIYRLTNGVTTTFAVPEGTAPLENFNVNEDRDGTLWFSFGGASGVLRFRDGNFTRYSTVDGLPNNTVHFVYEDREGTHWVATKAGIARLTDRPMTPYTSADGLSADNTYPILQDRAGDIWVGSWPGLTRIHNGTFEQMGDKLLMQSPRVISLFEDRDGAIWVGLFGGGLRKIHNGIVTKYDEATGAPGVTRAMAQDRDGSFWLGARMGLVHLESGVFRRINAQDGYRGGEVFSLQSDRNGVLWIGSEQGLTSYKNGVYTQLGAKDGFDGRRIRAIHEDRDGTLWLGSYDTGLYRYRDGRFTKYTTKVGLPTNGAFQIIEDDSGRFWISSNLGIYRVAHRDLEDVAAGRRAEITAVMYGRSDGMPTQECNGGGQPAGTRARDGRIWIPTQRGVAVFDPSAVATRVQPPPVVITDIIVGGRPTDERREVTIRSGSTTFEAAFTALTFVRPDLARFRYKMAGLDTEWVDAGQQKTARYPPLPYGTFTFKVIAANRDGYWNEEGASIAINIIRPFYRTTWFNALIAAVIVLIAAGLTRWRFVLLRRQQELQQAFSRQLIDSQESDRRRIASGLHDGVSQSLVVIKNRAIRANLAEIEATAAQALSEVREVVQDLVPYHLDTLGLAEAVREMAARVGRAAGITTHCHLAELDDLLPLAAQMSLFRVIQEAINNAVKHSNASNIWVEMSIDLDLLRVKIRDDGRGFTVGEGAPDPSRGGFGVVSMLERARMLGGRMILHSEPGTGTTIAIEMPIADGGPA